MKRQNRYRCNSYTFRTILLPYIVLSIFISTLQCGSSESVPTSASSDTNTNTNTNTSTGTGTGAGAGAGTGAGTTSSNSSTPTSTDNNVNNSSSSSNNNNNNNTNNNNINNKGNGNINSNSSRNSNSNKKNIRRQERVDQQDVVKHILHNLSTTKVRGGGGGGLATSSSTGISTYTWMNDEEATILDVFGQVAKDVLTNRMIPATDATCDWNWKHMRCEPYCTCSLQPQWGDYHMGRSCRKRFQNNNNNNTNNNDNNNTNNQQQQSILDDIDTDTETEKSNNNNNNNNTNEYDHLSECHMPPDTKIVKIMNASGRGFNMIKNVFRSKLHGVNFMIQNRVDHVKNDMCTSFLSIGTADEYDTDTYNVEGEGVIRNNIDDDNDSDDDEDGDGDDMLFEKPVRALRKALKCGNRNNSSSSSFVANENIQAQKSDSSSSDNHNVERSDGK